MMQKWLKSAAVIGLMVSAAAGAQAQAVGQMALGQITVTGTGTVQVVPDLANIDLGVTSQGDSAAAALDGNNAAMAAVMAQLAQAGIAARDLQTSNLQLLPNWVQADGVQNPQIMGYTATNMLTAQVRDLAVLGNVLDAAVQDGANTLQGVTFAQSDPKPAEAQARAAAVQDARSRASEIAAAAGVGLGRIISISEGGSYAPPAPMMRMAMADGGVPVAGGEIALSAQVTIVFEIVQ
jgi:uncharacterized protein YggE